jgi:phage baseplate assembly protein W
MNGLNISLKDKIDISKDDILIHSRLERLLFTDREERVGRLTFGSLIPQYFYEPADADLIADVIREVQFLIETYESELILSSIKCEVVQEGDLIGLIISLEVINSIDNRELNLEFLKVRSI